MVELSEAKAERYEGARMVALLWAPRADVLVTRVSGHVDRGAALFYTSCADRQLALSGKIAVFHDWMGITGFEPEVRQPYRDWATRIEGRVSPTFLVSSKVLSMALSVTALMLGRELTVLTDAAVFRGQLASALRGDPEGPRSKR